MITVQRMQLNMVIIAMVEHTRASCVIGNLAKNSFYRSQYGGQTIRQMEEFLRNGNQEEIEYQRQHGGTISDLFTGGKDNMVASITTLGTPHNGTPAADKIGT